MPANLPVTAVLITLNEEKNIPRILDHLQWVQEIVIVDGGSQDRTVALARAAGARIVDRRFDNFASQRNFALAAARTNWVLSLDADERPTSALIAEIRATVHDHGPVAYRIPIYSTIFGRRMRYSGTQDDCPIRLFRKDRAAWVGDVHEVLRVTGSVGRLRHGLEHHTLPNLAEFLRKMDHYTGLEARARSRAGRPPRTLDLVWQPAREFFRRFCWKAGWLDGPQGWAFCALSAWSEFVLARKHQRDWQSRTESVDLNAAPHFLDPTHVA